MIPRLQIDILLEVFAVAHLVVIELEFLGSALNTNLLSVGEIVEPAGLYQRLHHGERNHQIVRAGPIDFTLQIEFLAVDRRQPHADMRIEHELPVLKPLRDQFFDLLRCTVGHLNIPHQG